VRGGPADWTGPDGSPAGDESGDVAVADGDAAAGAAEAIRATEAEGDGLQPPAATTIGSTSAARRATSWRAVTRARGA
jgi:hypothetical protein